VDNQPIRIAHIMGKMVGGGLEAVVLNYYRAIDKSKVQFDFVVDSDSTVVPVKEIEELGGRVFFVPPYQSIKAYQKELEALVKQEQWRIVHSHMNTLSYFPLRVAKKCGVKRRIAHSHATVAKGEFSRNALKNILRPLTLRVANHYAACSHNAGDWMFGNRDYWLIPNALFVNQFCFNRVKRASVRQNYQDTDTLVLALGRLVHVKNFFFVIDVFLAYRETFEKNARLLIAGDGPLREQLQQYIVAKNATDCVELLVYMDRTEELYLAADVLCAPSFSEGFSMTCIEAQTSGLPVLASTGIPKEAVFNSNVVRLDLESGVGLWASELAKLVQKGRIEPSREDLHHIDVEYQATILADRYLEMWES